MEYLLSLSSFLLFPVLFLWESAGESPTVCVCENMYGLQGTKPEEKKETI